MTRRGHPESLGHTLAWIRCGIHSHGGKPIAAPDRPCGRCRVVADRDVSRHSETLIERTAEVVMDLDGHRGVRPTPLTYAYAVDLLDRLVPMIERRTES